MFAQREGGGFNILLHADEIWDIQVFKAGRLEESRVVPDPVLPPTVGVIIIRLNSRLPAGG